MVAMPASGIAMGYFSGYGLPFFWTKIEGTKTPNKELADNAYKVHSFLGQVLFYFVPLHVGAAFFHAYRGHKIFSRINPFLH
jgi:cytochrome b561